MRTTERSREAEETEEEEVEPDLETLSAAIRLTVSYAFIYIAQTESTFSITKFYSSKNKLTVNNIVKKLRKQITLEKR